MKKLKLLGFAPLLLAGVMMSAHADESTAGRVVDDSTITTKVKAALVGDTDVSALKVHVKTYKGTVQLNGQVETAEEKAAAEERASKVEGVVEVKNNLTVGETHHTAGKMMNDTEITTKVKAAFVGSPVVKASQINVTTKGGVVTLAGFADTAEAKTEAERLAGQVENVQRIANNVQVRQ
jgi:osmotically-inducible protein OsmY